MKNQVEYYRHPIIKEKLAQNCGGKFTDPPTFTCEYLVGSGEPLRREGYSFPIMVVENRNMLHLAEKGLDIFRAVWDKKSTLAVLDIDYFNLDSLAELYIDQLGIFGKMETLYFAVKGLLREYGISHINDTSASGYHLVSCIPFSSPVHNELEKIGYLNPNLKEKYRAVITDDIKRQRPVPPRDGKAYSAIGRLWEFLAYRLILETKKSSPLPVTISDTALGINYHPREGISLDLTQYGDSLFMRTIRLSFSTHQKHKINPDRLGKNLAQRTPIYIVVPRNNLSCQEVFEIRRDYQKAAEYAKKISVVIPDASLGWERVLRDYKNSALYKFHQEFDKKRYLKNYYRAIDWKSLPPCIHYILSHPYPALLAPTNILHLCRTFYCLGWHPKYIAGLIRSYYQRDYGWAVDWGKYDATTRANFWARVYCGMIRMNIDSLENFTCFHYQRSGFCPQQNCGYRIEKLVSKL